jgi:capsule polysaccharide export protein KpsE/RkpR
LSPEIPDPAESDVQELKAARAVQAKRLRLVWDSRMFFIKSVLIGLVLSVATAFLIPKYYTSTTQLMPPDSQSASGMAMMAALAGKAGGNLGSIAGDLLGAKSSGSLFIGVLRSQTAQDRLIQQFDLKKVYGKSLEMETRTKLDDNTAISEDRKSGIISISVSDHSPQRAAALAAAYVDQLNFLVAELSTSSAHRERVFLEERLKVVKRDLDDASDQLAQFSSKNNTIDIQQEGKAMLDAAANLAGQLIAAQSELEGLRQFYTDNNPRVKSLNARVGELRKELEKLTGVNRNGAPASDSSKDSLGDIPFPTIRNLPVLGVKYADYYRRAKIQETVFELLTEQYEMAKVQEAKETPSVKVLDPAPVPEKQSYPPRKLIIVAGTLLVVVLAAIWLFATMLWQGTDPEDPRRMLAQDVVGTIRARAHSMSKSEVNRDSTAPDGR